jgi:hypothetical protein
MISISPGRHWFGGLLILAALGCGGSSLPVSGNVTYEGSPIEEGAISFFPIDGKETSRGAMIKNGRYTADMAPGKWTVQITRSAKQAGPASSEDAYKKGLQADKESPIPANAVGNGATVEIKPGQQTLDFALKKPEAKKS